MSFEKLQRDLYDAWSATHAVANTDHVVVVLPSYSLVGTVQKHYAARIPALEHRFLLNMLTLLHVPGCEMVFVCSREPAPELLDYYTALLPEHVRRDVRDRFRTLVVPGPESRSLAANLRQRPDLLASLRTSFAGRPALLEPWNVTSDEVAVALALGAPMNGTPPELEPMGRKSGGRGLFARAGVPMPPGRVGVCSLADVVAAIRQLRDEEPQLRAVVVKLDDSTSGDGNRVIDTGARLAPHRPSDDVRRVEAALPPWYLEDLCRGGIVEALVEGPAVTSPSVQLDISPDGALTVLSTHEQVLSGAVRQVYEGCRFPANPAYARELAGHGMSIAAELARHGAVGRVGVDFVARQGTDGDWDLFALEVNLRKGGTTHPFTTLLQLVPGRYDPLEAKYLLPDGSSRYYCSTDNLLDPSWLGTPPRRVIDVVRRIGAQFDIATGTGVVLHMLTGLSIDGRFGLTAIGLTPDHAAGVYESVVAELRDSLARPATATASPAEF